MLPNNTKMSCPECKTERPLRKTFHITNKGQGMFLCYDVIAQGDQAVHKNEWLCTQCFRSFKICPKCTQLSRIKDDCLCGGC